MGVENCLSVVEHDTSKPTNINVKIVFNESGSRTMLRLSGSPHAT
jgi:hypothetical protein